MPFSRRRWLQTASLVPLSQTWALPASPAPQPLVRSRLAEIRAMVEAAVKNRQLPGAEWWIEKQGVVASGFHGSRARVPAVEPLTADTIFDLASLTKVVATTPSVMLLYEQGKLDIHDRVCRHLPEFTGDGREFITIKQLMSHTSGLRPGIPLNPPWTGWAAGFQLITTTEPFHLPDAQFRYSDINFLLLGELVSRVAKQPLDQFAKQHVFDPLRMKDTTYVPGEALKPRTAPTENDETGQLLRGVVHDPTSRRMGGVTGHAGLFSTIGDLARYSRMMLRQGELDGTRVLRPETVQLMTSVQSPPAMGDQRGLGWDLHSSYSRPRGMLFPDGSYGHTGFTGTCLWIDPASGSFYIFLSSRLHGTKGRTNILSIYERMGTLSAQAAGYVLAGGAGL